MTQTVAEVRKVVDRSGKGLSGFRVQVFYAMDIPGMTDGYGYSVVHTGKEGAFELGGLGPGPYRISVSDLEGHLAEGAGIPERASNLRITWEGRRNPETKE